MASVPGGCWWCHCPPAVRAWPPRGPTVSQVSRAGVTVLGRALGPGQSPRCLVRLGRVLDVLCSQAYGVEMGMEDRVEGSGRGQGCQSSGLRLPCLTAPFPLTPVGPYLPLPPFVPGAVNWVDWACSHIAGSHGPLPWVLQGQVMAAGVLRVGLCWAAWPGSELTRDARRLGFLQVTFSSVQFSSVAQPCPTLCDPMNRSTPGLPVHHKLPEFTQTQVHRISDAIQPSHPLPSPSPPAPNPSQHQSLFQ